MEYSQIITLVRESFSLVVLCALINLPIISFTSYGEAIQSIFAITFFCFFVLWPIQLYWNLGKNFKSLKKSDYLRVYGDAYEGLRLRQGEKVFLYPVYFYVRRFLFAVVVLNFSDHLAG